MRGGASKRCYNSDQPNSTPEVRHVIFAEKPDTVKKTCRRKRTNREKPAVGLIQNQEDVDVSEIGDNEDVYSQHENSVVWVNTPEKGQRSWDSDKSGDYVVMAIKSRKETELEAVGAKLPSRVNGKQKSV